MLGFIAFSPTYKSAGPACMVCDRSVVGRRLGIAKPNAVWQVDPSTGRSSNAGTARASDGAYPYLLVGPSCESASPACVSLDRTD